MIYKYESVTNPRFWGKHGWIFLISVVLSYPENPTLEDKQRFKLFFENMILPCFKCIQNYKQHLKILPLTDEVLKSKKNFENWIFQLRSLVDKSTGNKSKYTIVEFFEDVNKKSNTINWNSLISFTPIIIIIFVLIYHYKIKN